MVSSYALVGDDAFVLIDPQVPTDEADGARLWDALDRDVDAHGPPAILISVHYHTCERRGHRRSLRRQLDLGAGGLTREQTRPQPDLRHRRRAARRHPSVRRRDAGERALYLPSHKAIVFGDAVLDGVRLLPLPAGWRRA